MENLNLSDLCILIPMLERELDKIHQEIESDDDKISSDASDLSVPYGETAARLEKLYNSLLGENSNYPSYDELTKRK